MTVNQPPTQSSQATTGDAPLEPAFYNDLAGSLAEGWRMLAEAARDRTKPMHTVAIASVGQDRRPNVRTVVLRAANPTALSLRFHTDLRSPKIGDLTASNAVQLLAYDPGQKVQLRMSGRATIHHGDEVWRAAWQAAQPQSRLCYRQHTRPGAVLTQPDDAITSDAPGADDGKVNFAAVVISVSEIDWLYLAAAGHRRALFQWAANGELSSTWLAP